jgi:F-type H+-transporting ATPase subunit epsilon
VTGVALNVTITTPEGLAYEGEARIVVVPALDGELGILPRHAPLIGQLGPGELRVSQAAGSEAQRWFIDGGFVQVLRDKVVVIAARAEAGKKFDGARAEEDLRALLGQTPPAGEEGRADRQGRAEKIRVARARVRFAARIRGKA